MRHPAGACYKSVSFPAGAHLASNPIGDKATGKPAAPATTRSAESARKPDDTGTLDYTWLAATPSVPVPVPQGQAGSAAAPAGLEPAVEEAAILFANGNVAEAKARLLKSIRQEQPGAAAERLWLMLFDLHQAQGEQREFEARSLEFALKFLRSAPAWRGSEPADAALQTGGGTSISLAGKLSAESAPQMEKIRALAGKNRLLRVDFSKLQGADGPGCGLLLDLLQTIRRLGGDAMFTGESVLLGALSNATRPGAKDVAPSLWLLRLEILQWQGRQAEFDEVALDYAITYEVSPPSFEPHVHLKAPEAAPATAAEPAGDALRVPRDFVDGDERFLKRIEKAAAARELVVLDFSDTQRVDFATAGKLLNLVANLAGHGKRLEVQRPSALVGALLEAMGISAHATVVARK